MQTIRFTYKPGPVSYSTLFSVQGSNKLLSFKYFDCFLSLYGCILSIGIETFMESSGGEGGLNWG